MKAPAVFLIIFTVLSTPKPYSMKAPAVPMFEDSHLQPSALDRGCHGWPPMATAKKVAVEPRLARGGQWDNRKKTTNIDKKK